jgi:hypothetical protein
MAPQRPIGYWLKLLDQLINEQFDSILEEHGVTRRQWQMMNLLSSGPASRGQLDEALAPFSSGSEPDTLAEQLSELVDSGWVVGGEDTFALTEHGQTSFGRLGEVVGRSRETLSRGISSEEYARTLEVLERMSRNLGWDDPADNLFAEDLQS